MTENNFNMQSFRHSIYLDRPVEDVYKLIGTGNGLTKWFIGKSVYKHNGTIMKDEQYIQSGDEFKWDWLEKDLSIEGKVLVAEENNKLKFTFGSTFIVTITVKAEKGKTLFTLYQEYLPGVKTNDFAHINCCVCWAFFITNLKSVIESGNDLRETQIDNEELVNR